jgi:hypothetical protein
MKTEDAEKPFSYESEARNFASKLSRSLDELVYISYCNRSSKYYTSLKKTTHNSETLVACYEAGEEMETSY